VADFNLKNSLQNPKNHPKPALQGKFGVFFEKTGWFLE
jgi:hypothetical protein